MINNDVEHLLKCLLFNFLFVFLFFWISHNNPDQSWTFYVVQTALRFVAIFLPQPTEFWNYKCELPYLGNYFVKILIDVLLNFHIIELQKFFICSGYMFFVKYMFNKWLFLSLIVLWIEPGPCIVKCSATKLYIYLVDSSLSLILAVRCWKKCVQKISMALFLKPSQEHMKYKAALMYFSFLGKWHLHKIRY